MASARIGVSVVLNPPMMTPASPASLNFGEALLPQHIRQRWMSRHTDGLTGYAKYGNWRMNRIVMALALPVGILSAVLTVTIVLSWVQGVGLCDTWMASLLPYCT